MSEQKLPVVGPDSGGTGVPPPPMQVEASSAKLVGTLAGAGVVAGLAIVLVFQWANPRIEEHRARMLAEAITEVLAGADRFETVFLDGGEFTASPVSDTSGLDRVYVGYDPDDRPVGIAVRAAEPGFQDLITLIFGYDPGTGDLMGMKVIENKETPGLGDKIVKDSTFVRSFDGVATPLVALRAGRESGRDGEVVTITGATISSTAVINIINHRLEELSALMDSFWSSPAVVGRCVGECDTTIEGGIR